MSALNAHIHPISSTTINGWIELTGENHQETCLDLYIDDIFTGRLTIAPPDRNSTATAETIRHEFSAPIPARFQDGKKHQIDICAADTLISLNNGFQHIKLPAINTQTSAPASTKNQQAKPPFRQGTFEGKLDRVHPRDISGWIWDKQHPNTPLVIEVLDGDTVIECCTAEIYRADLEDAGKGNGRHAFRIPTPPILSDGKPHSISIRLKESGITLHPGALPYKHKAERPYHTFDEYLNWAMIHREFHYPLQENDQRVLAYMDWYRQHLHLQHPITAKMPLISVIMPAFNREDVIGDALESLTKQTYPHWELLVVDDASKDGTAKEIRKAAKRDPRIRLICHDENRGAAIARNTALAEAKGNYIAYLDSDNTWEIDYLQLMQGVLASTTGAKSIYSAQHITQHYESALHGQQDFYSIRFGPFHRAYLENRNYIDLNCYMHHRSLYDQLGGFNIAMKRYSDWELILRYTAEIAPLALPCVLSLYFHGRSANQISATEHTAPAEALIDATLRGDMMKITSPSPNDHVFFHLHGNEPKPSKLQKSVSIVIASYEAPEYLKLCVESVHQHTPASSYEIIIVDNASSAETQIVLDELELHPAVTLIRNKSNTGFTYATNQGIEAAKKSNDIILLNNDALVTHGWVSAMQDVLEIESNVGIVIPRQTLLPHTNTLDTHVPTANMHREMDVTLSAHHANILNPEANALKGYVELNFAPFFCAYITRKCLKKTGLLDAINGRHYRSDRIYCDAVRHMAKLRIIYTPHSKLYHFLQQSTAALKQSNADDYQKIFVENRWDDGELAANQTI